MRAKYLIPTCVAVAATAIAAEPTGNPAGLDPDTPQVESGRPASDHANAQDRLFVRQAALGGRAEVELSQLAQRQAVNPEVKQFSQRMIDDHTKSNERLLRIGRPFKVEIPKELDAEGRDAKAVLEKAPAAERDVQYLAAQIRTHQKTVNLLAWHLSYGQNEALRQYSAETLPDVIEHLEQARALYSRLTTQPRSRS